MADIFQDINRVSSFRECLKGTFSWRNCSVKTLLHYVTQLRRVTNTNLLFWVNLPNAFNGAVPSRKCSIKAPAKWRNSVYVLTEICHQRSKWLRPIRFFFQIRQSHSLGNFGCYIFSIITWRGCVIVNRVFPSSELNLWMWWMNRKYPITVTKIGIEIG